MCTSDETRVPCLVSVCNLHKTLSWHRDGTHTPYLRRILCHIVADSRDLPTTTTTHHHLHLSCLLSLPSPHPLPI